MHEDAKEYIDCNTKKNSESGCWEWTALTNTYGVLRSIWRHRFKVHHAHRLAFILYKGPIEIGKQICHSCDNPVCCNPEHLWEGSIKENMQDRTKKGRTARGSKNGAAKLTEEQVKEIRVKLENKVKARKIAAEYGVTASLISCIKNGKAWR